MPFENPVDIIDGEYDYNEFLSIARGLEAVPEGGERCFKCYRLRLEQTAKLAKEKGFDYFCTTLSISPLKKFSKNKRNRLCRGRGIRRCVAAVRFQKKRGL